MTGLAVPRFPIDPSDRKPVGRSGETTSAIGIGTWAIRDYRRAEETLVEAVENGIDLIDTAEMYGWGLAEELVGRVVRRVGRGRVFITTKLLPERFRDEHTAEKALKASLARLGVRSVDLVLIHWPDPHTSIERQVRVLESLWAKGLARYIGVSNFNEKELLEALSATKRAEIVVDQVHYSVLHREPVESKLLPMAVKEGVTIQAYTPLERGKVVENLLLREVARELGKTPVQVALNYLISKPRVVAIPKTERRDHLREILGAMGWRLSPRILELLENL
ncbi:aldo/keto reductase [Pyrolobus fumarii 1A]|uniref:Aldo/keto reductase n=1 Tax=Pyrolobus fumarii (strain DSM 11204 / 1A) TaxID=694429 RepID=G0EGW3_PYRF1|nr:aldo/keto reductase [Pyrolobus fumarii 1A]